MNIRKSISSDVKNLKNYYKTGTQKSIFVKQPRLITSGYLIDDPDWSSNVHMHDFSELILCTGGLGKTTIYNSDYDIFPGDLIVHNPNTPHCETSNPKDPLNFLFIGVTDFQLFKRDMNILIDRSSCPVIKTENNRDQLESLFTEIVRETILGKAYYKEIAEALSISILTIVMRLTDSKKEEIPGISSHSMRIKEYIDNNYTEDFKLSELSSALYISQTYISHIFKSDMGISPMQYMVKKRIALAKELLTTSSMSVSEISARCGYDDPVYFSQVFKRVVGSSPKQFRADSIEK